MNARKSSLRLVLPIFAAVGLASVVSLGCMMTAAKPALADDDVSNQFTVTATQSGSTVNIVIAPTSDKYFINSEYNIKLNLTAKDGGTVDHEKLGKADGHYVASDHEGKAKSVTFSVEAPKGVTGDGKLVVCALDACGNPTKFTFESH